MAISGTYYIDALLQDTAYRWNADSDLGTATTVTYSFMRSVPANADREDARGFTAFSTVQQEAARRAFAEIQSVCNITFQEVRDGSAVNVRLANNSQGGVSAGYAYLPNSSSDGRGGQVYLATESRADGLVQGQYGYATLLHEIGHALGLKHPGNYNAGSTGEEAGIPPYLPAAEDNIDNTLMSYNDATSDLSAATLMPYDIAALQYVYGVNTATGAGASTYSFTDTALLQTVYDASGIDTFDFQALSRGATVDLAAGGRSSAGLAGGVPAVSNLVIALDTVIENAVGSNHADSLQGNASANTLTGGAGDDTLLGMDGTDLLYGGTGADVIDGGADADTIYAGQGNDSVAGGDGNDRIETGFGMDTILGGAGDDVVLSGQDDDLIMGGQGNDLIMAGQGNDDLRGGQGNDTLSSGLGDDTLVGGQGDDSLIGMGGTDWLDGGLGNDTLIGGDDGDVFLLSAASGDDRIEGFQVGSDLIRLSGAGAGYSIADSGGGALLRFAAGGSALFVGVAGTDLTGGILLA